LMRRHLSADLDRQAGRAEAAFLRHVGGAAGTGDPVAAAPPAPPPGPRLSPAAPRRFMKFGPWMMTWAGTALAACLAALWAGPALFPARPAGPPAGGIRPSHPSPSAGV